MSSTSPPTDLLGAIIGAPAGSAFDRLRGQRPDIQRHTQGYHDVLLAPADPGGLSRADRAWIAWKTATLSRHAALAAHYRAMLDAIDPALATTPPSGRLAVIDAHVTRVTTAPGSATQAHIDALRTEGLTPRDIVALTQVIAFVSYQVRAAAGLSLLVQDPAP